MGHAHRRAVGSGETSGDLREAGPVFLLFDKYPVENAAAITI